MMQNQRFKQVSFVWIKQKIVLYKNDAIMNSVVCYVYFMLAKKNIKLNKSKSGGTVASANGLKHY